MYNSGSSADYIYDLKDYLGNVRVSYKDDGSGNPSETQCTHYYPFGMRINGLCPITAAGYENKYLYNSKELQDDFDLNWYHYGARYYRSEA